jgi:HK97 family phage major capsid protein
MNLPALRETRATKVDALKSIITNATNERRDLNDNEQAAFDAGKLEIEKVERDIRNAEFLAEAERRAHGEPVSPSGDQRFDVEQRAFSIRKAIAAQIPGSSVDCGREKEISRELERRSGRTAEGLLVPMSVFEKRVVTSTLPATGPGSHIIPMDYDGVNYIDRLREAMVIRRLGARVLSGLVGNVGIPKLQTSATSYWVAENTAITASDIELDMIAMTPKHCGCLTEVSRNMVMQSSPDIEQLLRDDFALILARALDLAAIKGGGANEPYGVLASTGIGDVPVGAAGGPITWALINSLITTVDTSNALNGSLGFLTNSKVTGKASGILKSSADTASTFIMENPGAPTLAGYPLAVTNLVPSNLVKGGSGAVCSALIFGNWSDMLIGYWSAFDLLVNPYETTAYSKGNVQVRGMLTADITLRHVESFAAIKDLTT